MKKLSVILMFLVVTLSSCREKPQSITYSSDASKKASDAQMKESLEKANRVVVQDEEEDILNFARRHQWDLVSTGTGLRYQIVKAGEGPLIQPGQEVTAEYVLYDILGDVVYTSDKEGLMRFTVGQGGAVTGMDEAMRYLHQGDWARVIVPSHLGYGLLGDQKSVPSKATLIYTLKIKEVK